MPSRGRSNEGRNVLKNRGLRTAKKRRILTVGFFVSYFVVHFSIMYDHVSAAKCDHLPNEIVCSLSAALASVKADKARWGFNGRSSRVERPVVEKVCDNFGIKYLGHVHVRTTHVKISILVETVCSICACRI